MSALRKALSVAALSAALVTGGAATAVAQPADPGLFCRPTVGMPYSNGYTTGGGVWNGEFEASGGMNCNGPTSVTITIIFHHHAESLGGTTVDSGAQAGSNYTCQGSCSAATIYKRNGMGCGVPFIFDDYAQMVGTWVEPTSGQTINIDVEGAHTNGSAYNPPGCS